MTSIIYFKSSLLVEANSLTYVFPLHDPPSKIAQIFFLPKIRSSHSLILSVVRFKVEFLEIDHHIRPFYSKSDSVYEWLGHGKLFGSISSPPHLTRPFFPPRWLMWGAHRYHVSRFVTVPMNTAKLSQIFWVCYMSGRGKEDTSHLQSRVRLLGKCKTRRKNGFRVFPHLSLHRNKVLFRFKYH